MPIDITSHIRDLLYEHDSVIIPQLGSIVSMYQPAAIDHVQGLLHPPSKKLTFTDDLQTNDNLLVDHVKQKNDLSSDEALWEVERFVFETQKRLDNKEIVILPGIGRLYRDYENNLRFLQDTTNFNTAAFGLPSLQFYPVMRLQEAPVLKKTKPQKHVAIKKELPTRQPLAKKIASIFLPALIIVATFIWFYTNKEKIGHAPEIQKIPVFENRLNIKPSLDNMSSYGGISESRHRPDDFRENQHTNPQTNSKIPSGAIPQKECIVIIGVFSKKSGVEQRLKDIYNFGYEAYQDKVSDLTRVGVRFGYDQKEEVDEMLEAIREKFDERAWILTEE